MIAGAEEERAVDVAELGDADPLTSVVPAGVPSVPYVALKRRAPRTSTNRAGEDAAAVSKAALMSLTRKACVSGPPCWRRATGTIVRSEHISATTTVQAFTYVHIAGPPLPEESSSERIDRFTGSTHGTGCLVERAYSGIMRASCGETRIGRPNSAGAQWRFLLGEILSRAG